MRSGSSSALGKLTELISIRVDPETKELLEREANKARLSAGEYCRMLIMGRLHGEQFMLQQYADTLRRVINGSDDK